MNLKEKVDNLLILIEESDIDYEDKIQRLAESKELYELDDIETEYFYFLCDYYYREVFPLAKSLVTKTLVILGSHPLSKNTLMVYVADGINVSTFTVTDNIKWKRKYYLDSILE